MRGGWRAACAARLLLLAALMWWPAAARADAPEIHEFEIVRNEEGVQLNFAVRFDLPRNVEDALLKGVPLYFVAEAEVFRDRWYWTDRRVARAQRTWRVAY